jgi:hypothetical protein
MSLTLAGFVTAATSSCVVPAVKIVVTQASKKDEFNVWTSQSKDTLNKYPGTKDYTAVLQFWISQTDGSSSECIGYFKTTTPDVTATKNGNFLVLKYVPSGGSEVFIFFFRIADYEFLLEDARDTEARLLVVLHRASQTVYSAKLEKNEKFPNIPVRKETQHKLKQFIE